VESLGRRSVLGVPQMSIEVRFRHEGRCECGAVVVGGYKPECIHWTECDLGRFGDNAECDPRKPADTLMLTTRDYVHKVLATGPTPGPRGGMHSVTQEDHTLFAHMEYEGKTTTWKLHEAHWEDAGDPEILVGKLVE